MMIMENNMKSHSQFERFYDFMEHDTRGSEIITYGIASIGLIAAIYKIRPFSKFQKPSDIPQHFIKSKTPLQGTVTHIEINNNPIILLDHKPLIQLPSFQTQRSLPVKIAGININSNGLSWLQTVVVGRNVKCIPISIKKEALDCILIIPQKSQEPLVVGSELAQLGFGTIQPMEPELLNDKDIVKYQQSLERAQRWAIRKRNGLWHFAIPPSLLWKLRSSISNLISPVLPSKFVKYLNI